jgi:dephospho-CoA kinase
MTGRRLITVGLTGGIGSGKGAVAEVLAEFGAAVIDADQIGHQVYAPGTTGWRRVVEAFGSEVVGADGRIDRALLGQRVFADAAQRARLNGIVHPLIRDALVAKIARERAAGRAPIVVEAAVLIEASWQDLVDEVWLVTARRDVVERRLALGRGMGPDVVAARLDAQLSDDERAGHAAVVIDNNGTLAELRARVERLWRERLSN